jgi:hypothetical protein
MDLVVSATVTSWRISMARHLGEPLLTCWCCGDVLHIAIVSSQNAQVNTVVNPERVLCLHTREYVSREVVEIGLGPSV